MTTDSDQQYLQRISDALRAGYGASGNLELVYLSNGREACAVIHRSDIPALLRVITHGSLPAADASEREQVIRLLADRIAALENLTTRTREDHAARIARLDVTIGDNHRRRNTSEEVMGQRIQEMCARRAEAEQRLERRIDVLRDRVEAVEGRPGGDAGAGDTELATALASVIDTIGSIQEVVAKIQIPLELHPEVATKAYVDEAIRRLNAALRDFVRKVFEQALRAAAPPPGLVRRLWEAARTGGRPADPTTESYRAAAAAITPERAAALGTEAARKAAGA